MADLNGQQVGQYTILSKLGEGGMASVYRARQASVNRDVAIKIIRSKLAQTPEYMRRFEREARTLASLDHLHILKIFDFGQQDDILYLAMELKTGGNLATLIRSGALSLAQIGRYLEQIGDALDYAHRKGVIHRDLKPQNVLLDESGNAILTDFGIAKLITKEATQLTNTGSVMGTPAYMAPEQWQGGTADARTDFYALGIMLYEMLGGGLPFTADTPAQMMYFHLQSPAPSIRGIRPDVPEAVEAVLQKAIAKAPSDRFPSGRALSDAFAAATRGVMPGGLSTGTQTSYVAAAPAQPITRLGGQGQETVAARPKQQLPLMIGMFVVVVVLAIAAVLLAMRPSSSGGGTPSATPSNAIAVLPSATEPPPVQATTAAPTAIPLIVTLTATPSFTATQTASATATNTLTSTVTFTPSLLPGLITLTAQAIELTSIASITTGEAIRQTESFGITATAQSIAQTQLANQQTRDAAQKAILALSFTPTFTLTVTPSPTPTNTATDTPSATPSPSVTATLTATPTFTQTPSPTATPTASTTPTVVRAATGNIAFASNRSGRYQLYIYSVTTQQTRSVSGTAGDDFGPAWSPDGQRIAFTSNRTGHNEIYTLKVDGSEVRRLTRIEKDSYAPAWSPDSAKIMFHSNRTGDYELYVMNADGSGTRRVTTNTGDDSDASWSPDGKYIAFHSKRGTNHGIYIMDASNYGNIRRLSPDGIDAFDPAWSPDGTSIVFTVIQNKKPSIYVMNADGSNVHPLLTNAVEDDQPAWDPSSKYIVFRSKRNGRVDLYLADITGQNLTRLTSSGNDNQFPTWQPSVG